MKSFRSELENPVVEKDIIALERKIREFREGGLPEERFRSLRLARGVYGQRQPGVQMVRIKLPYGKVSSRQLRRIAGVSDTFSTGKLHITTRQDIQIHYVDLERTPELWAELERDQVTLREACGNTVRNVTASETAGIDPSEPFDVSPYAQAVFDYFLRNPVGQEMGRKFKVSFSASESDTGLSYMHDLGFIARLRNGERGFRVLLGGGLGAQPRHADLLYDFLPQQEIIPLMECVVRVFDQYGERKNRSKARLKFLLKDLGLEGFKALVEQQRLALPLQELGIEHGNYPEVKPAETAPEIPEVKDQAAYRAWMATNVLPQKQAGFKAVGVRVFLGNFTTDQARSLANLAEGHGAGELRFSLRQNLLIPYVREAWLPYFYQELSAMGLAAPGYNSAADITACPGTDTCNLGIASSTGIASELERVIAREYPEFLYNPDVVIKISGCMNACGQHTMAHIGFQGMSVRTPDQRVAPALQVLLGGGNLGGGQGLFADKVVKIPSKRGPMALRLILDDYLSQGNRRPYHEYYREQGQLYFYDLLKPLTAVDDLEEEDFIDWGNREKYQKEIGVGECAGVVIDLVATLLFEAEEKLAEAAEALVAGKWAAAIYLAYSARVQAAKALLTAEDHPANTHAGIVEDFDRRFGHTEAFSGIPSLGSQVALMQETSPAESFARRYTEEARAFVKQAEAFRRQTLSHAS